MTDLPSLEDVILEHNKRVSLCFRKTLQVRNAVRGRRAWDLYDIAVVLSDGFMPSERLELETRGEIEEGENHDPIS